MKKSHRILGIVVVVAAAVLVTWGSVEFDWFPDLISPVDGKIDSVYKWLLIGSVPFFVIIVAAIAFMLIEFRATGEDDDRDGAPLHGSTLLEIIWTTIPTLIVIGLGIYAWMVLTDIEAKQPNELKIDVVGQQFAWSFAYPEEKIKTNELVVPVGRALQFNITSVDVVHSFFVPNARLKRDATPGIVKHIRFRPTKLGDYPIVCTELCGIGHATMRQTLHVVPKATYAKWLKAGGGTLAKIKDQAGGGKATGGGEADAAAAGKSVFNTNGCGGCHVLPDAGAAGKIGPTLVGIGKLKPAQIEEMIVDPDADVAKGYSKGVMPPNFGESISKEDLAALVAYLQQAGK